MLSAVLAALILLGQVGLYPVYDAEPVPAHSGVIGVGANPLLIDAKLAASAVGTVMVAGQANFANPSHGSDYLAMRLPRGTVVQLCGAGGCWTGTVNDYGPVEATGDIADIALVRFAHVCGYSIAEAKLRGECAVTAEYGWTLPPTDTAPDWAYWHGLVR